MSEQHTTAYVRSYEFDGRVVECYGTRYADTPEGEYDHYDLFEDGVCLNEGDPLYDTPTVDEVRSWYPTE
jgi:hypothetical protein